MVIILKAKMFMNKKNASATLYIIFFLVIFLAFAAFAVDGAIVFTNRLKLQNITEMTALAAASEFNYDVTATQSQISDKVTNEAIDAFNLLKNDGLQTANITELVDPSTRKVTITANMVAQPLFLRFLGISGINLKAIASAVSYKLFVTANYSGVNWLTPKAAYLSDILSKDLNMNDTAILLPLGNFPSASYVSGIADFGLISSKNNQSLSLGPGGFITIRLPVPIVNKPGPDLFIEETGALEGYMVFAGLDNDPNLPYQQKDNEGAGISWVNISCSGTPENSSLGNAAHQTANTQLSVNIQDKFYGSGYFDLDSTCLPAISMVKYIRIVDDNSESAFVTNNGVNYYKAMLYGEASTANSGADIDYVQVLNYVKLE